MLRKIVAGSIRLPANVIDAALDAVEAMFPSFEKSEIDRSMTMLCVRLWALARQIDPMKENA